MSWFKFKYHLGTSSEPRPFPTDIELEIDALRKERDEAVKGEDAALEKWTLTIATCEQLRQERDDYREALEGFAETEKSLKANCKNPPPEEYDKWFESKATTVLAKYPKK